MIYMTYDLKTNLKKPKVNGSKNYGACNGPTPRKVMSEMHYYLNFDFEAIIPLEVKLHLI